MDKCCSLECMAFTNWALDEKPLFVSALVTHPRVQGDLLYHRILSTKQQRCKKKFCCISCAARLTK